MRYYYYQNQILCLFNIILGLVNTTVELSGISSITTEFIPIFTLSPIDTPDNTLHPAPSSTLLPICPLP